MTDLALAAFVTRCITEDERAAQFAVDEWNRWHGGEFEDTGEMRAVEVFYHDEMGVPRLPFFALADCASKRQLVDLFSSMQQQSTMAGHAERGMRLLAAAYRGRDGWREEWSLV